MMGKNDELLVLLVAVAFDVGEDGELIVDCDVLDDESAAHEELALAEDDDARAGGVAEHASPEVRPRGGEAHREPLRPRRRIVALPRHKVDAELEIRERREQAREVALDRVHAHKVARARRLEHRVRMVELADRPHEASVEGA